MDKIIKDSQGRVLMSTDGAYKADASIDPNITPANIKQGVNILGVEGTYEGGADWIINAKTTDEPFSLNQAQQDGVSLLAGLNHGATALFYGNRMLTGDVRLNVQSVANNALSQCFYGCTSTGEVHLDSLESVDDGGLNEAFRASYFKKFYAPNLRTVGVGALSGLFRSGYNLEYVDLSSLETNDVQAYGYCFSSCSKLTTVVIHPNCLKAANQNNNPLYSATAVSHLTLSQVATDNLSLQSNPLDAESILSILRKLSTEVTGKTCTFRTTTISASNPNYDAIHALVESLTNWTITGLTL